MSTAIRMPDFGATVQEVRLVSWTKRVGDNVRRGETLCQVETDKANVDFESYAEGVLLVQVVPAGNMVIEGQVIAYVGQPGETVPASTPSQETAPAVKISPMIRKFAQREGVDLNTVTPTGPGGQVTREDVLRTKTGVAAEPAQTKETLSPRQQVIARRVIASHLQIVPIYLAARIDMTAAVALRRSNPTLTFDAIFVSAAGRVLERFERFRCFLEGETLRRSPGVHVGLAVSFNQDLYTVTIREVPVKSPAQVQSEIEFLVDKAKRGKIATEEMSGACFTVSNLGMYPVEWFSVVISPGQSGALAVGSIEESVVMREGKVCSFPSVVVTLAVDHRLINGREAAEFLKALKEAVEKP